MSTLNLKNKRKLSKLVQCKCLINEILPVFTEKLYTDVYTCMLRFEAQPRIIFKCPKSSFSKHEASLGNASVYWKKI